MLTTKIPENNIQADRKEYAGKINEIIEKILNQLHTIKKCQFQE